MSAAATAAIVCISLLILILAGVHIAFSLGVMSIVGIFLLTDNFSSALSIMATTSFSAIRQYTFAVVPLFVLMGCFMSKSGVAKDLFDTMNYALKRLPGGLGIATVLSNAVFAAVTGVSVASAAVFSKISLPAMRSYHYRVNFALGSIAGSSVLGMLIPPSLLMIVYGMLSETSIGKLFIAGIVPGILLAVIYSIGIILMSLARPELIGRAKMGAMEQRDETKALAAPDKFLPVLVRSLPIFLIVLVVLGGIWGGFFTPTEASAIGALATMLLSLARGMRWEGMKEVILDAGGTTATILFLLITAQMYSRMLSMSGITVKLGHMVEESELGGGMVLLLICALLVILGCVLDSTSILLITVPLILPIAAAFQWDLLWLGIVMIVVIEMGLLTPPFGMVVFAMKATIEDEDVTVEGVFKGAFPFLLMMVFMVGLLVLFPSLVTWLPGLQ